MQRDFGDLLLWNEQKKDNIRSKSRERDHDIKKSLNNTVFSNKGTEKIIKEKPELRPMNND